MAFETILMAAGIVNSSKDCKIPTKENAAPVNIMVGNNILENLIQIFAVSVSIPSAKSQQIGSANTIPKTVIIQVTRTIIVIKILDSWKASSFPFFLNIH